jgi:hypothetical protein
MDRTTHVLEDVILKITIFQEAQGACVVHDLD